MPGIGFLTFASEADELALVGAGFVLLALVALLLERMRVRRKRLERVGWVPWTAIFMTCAIIGGGLLSLSLPAALFGS